MSSQNYWIPDPLPEKTEEYNQSQASKKYFTHLGEERMHPKWIYDNGAYVDDEYLFQNEGWKLIVDVTPEYTESQYIKKLDISEWIEDEKTLTVQYKVYDISEENKPSYDERNQDIKLLDFSSWTLDDVSDKLYKEWEVVNLSEQEVIDRETVRWKSLREKRDLLLKESDVAVLRAYEQNVAVSEEVVAYRQLLRDLPSTITDIFAEVIWPQKPAEIN